MLMSAFVSDADVALHCRLGLKLTARTSNTAGGFAQAFFFLKGGGLIEIVGPNDNVANKATADFARYMAKRGDGFKYLTLDGSAGCVDALHAAGVKTRETDRTHSDVHKSATLTKVRACNVKARLACKTSLLRVQVLSKRMALKAAACVRASSWRALLEGR